MYVRRKICVRVLKKSTKHFYGASVDDDNLNDSVHGGHMPTTTHAYKVQEKMYNNFLTTYSRLYSSFIYLHTIIHLIFLCFSPLIRTFFRHFCLTHMNMS